MKPLPKNQDPSGFFNSLRRIASMLHGDANGYIHPHGRYQSPTKKGPGRRQAGKFRPPGFKLWRKSSGVRT